jgi:hypothetical protein
MTYRKITRPNTQPQRWKTGPDLRTHLQYRAWVQQRNQAIFREEGWRVTFEEYQDLWQDHWEQRGRLSTSYMMTRANADRPWSWANCVVITRQQHGQRQADNRATGWKSRARERELNSAAATD